MNYHLVILKKAYLELILDGRKSVESRFTKTRRAPFGQISIGDKLFFKQSSGAVCAVAVVEAVKQFENLSPRKILWLKQKYNSLICGGEGYRQEKRDCGFGVLVWLKNVKPVEPVRIDKKDRRAWVVLTDAQNYGLLKESG